MSSDTLARVEACADKAYKLADKGHLLRAAENFGCAAEAARALGEDNLVAVHMRLQQFAVLNVYATTASDAVFDPHSNAAHRVECIALLSGAVEALERRRMTDSLLEGKCTAVEEAWYAGLLQLKDAHCTPVEAASWAALVGYQEYLYAASYVSVLLHSAILFTRECSNAQFQSFAEHVVHAADLMQQPLRHGDTTIVHGWNSKFAHAFRDAVEMAGVTGLNSQLLLGAWQRLQRSGVLQAPHMEEGGIPVDSPEVLAFEEAVQKSMTAPGLRSCALPGCGAKEAHPAHFKSCGACRAVVYCCREHQAQDWPSHKKACKAARKAASAAEEDGAGPSGA